MWLPWGPVSELTWFPGLAKNPRNWCLGPLRAQAPLSGAPCKRKPELASGSVALLVAESCLTLQLHRLQPARLFCPWASPGKNAAVGCHFLLQGIFLIQGLNPGLPHCRQILYLSRHQGFANWPGLVSVSKLVYVAAWAQTSILLHFDPRLWGHQGLMEGTVRWLWPPGSQGSRSFGWSFPSK